MTSPTVTGATLVCAFLVIVWNPLPVTSVVTSYEKLRMLAEQGEEPLLQAIRDDIEDAMKKIENLTSLLTAQMKNKPGDHEFKMDHPNDFYLLVKHYVRAWHSEDENITEVLEKVIADQRVSFPIATDFDEAVKALIRLQSVYKLRATDMFEGNYLGYRGSPLDMEDAYFLGKEAVSGGFLEQGMEWLQLSLSLQKKALDNESADPEQSAKDASEESLETQYIMTLSLLGRAHFYKKDVATAQRMYEECNASGVEDVGDVEALLEELQSEDVESVQNEYELNVLDSDDNVSILCSREKNHRLSKIRPYHVCRYKSDVLVPIQRYREEILSLEPYASLFYDVIYDSEIERFKEIARKKLSRGRTSGNHVSDVRTGDLGWIADEDDPLAARLSQRVTSFTGLDVTGRKDEDRISGEQLQVVNYGIGGHYGVHLDALGLDDFQDRLATVLFYLTEVEKGGATIFPHLGVSVSPVKGMALLWYNYAPDIQSADKLSLHSGCPVVMGNKWIANKWVWIYGNTFRRPCGPSPNSTQLEVEKLVTTTALKTIIE